MRKMAFVVFALTFSLRAFSDVFDITRVGVDLNQQTFFIGVVQSAASSPCSVKTEFKWNLSVSGVKEIETMAIAAKSMAKKLVIGIDPVNCVAGQVTGLFVYME